MSEADPAEEDTGGEIEAELSEDESQDEAFQAGYDQARSDYAAELEYRARIAESKAAVVGHVLNAVGDSMHLLIRDVDALEESDEWKRRATQWMEESAGAMAKMLDYAANIVREMYELPWDESPRNPA